MRTTFYQVRLFNDNILVHLLYETEKGKEGINQQGERDRECMCDRALLRKGCSVVINLTIGQLFIGTRERIIQDLIKMVMKLIPRIYDV
jgi:hypothetical protein